MFTACRGDASVPSCSHPATRRGQRSRRSTKRAVRGSRSLWPRHRGRLARPRTNLSGGDSGPEDRGRIHRRGLEHTSDRRPWLPQGSHHGEPGVRHSGHRGAGVHRLAPDIARARLRHVILMGSRLLWTWCGCRGGNGDEIAKSPDELLDRPHRPVPGLFRPRGSECPRRDNDRQHHHCTAGKESTHESSSSGQRRPLN